VSAGQPSEVDLDLLADYVGGALDGTDQQKVARLIAQDPAWQQAHAWLVRTSEDVRDVLAEWGTVPTPMPADVVGRLTAALATATADAAATADATATADDRAGRGRADRRVGAPREFERPERGSRPPTRRDTATAGRMDRTKRPTTGRRMRRWVTPLAVLAALIAFAGLGVAYLTGDDRAVVSGTALRDDSAEGGAGAPASATTPSQQFAASLPVRLLSTGTDYTRASLGGQVNALRLTDARATAKGSGTTELSRGPAAPGAAPGPDSIAGCVTAVTAAHGRGTLSVEWVDAATFEGLPALVVVFADRTGERWAWVVSPECGRPKVGAATRYSARVG